MSTTSLPSRPVMPWAGHIKATLLLGMPIAGASLAQVALNVTDTVMLGWYGVEELAASVLATSLWFVLFIVGSGFALAVMPMTATAEGEGDKTQVRRVTRMGLWITLAYCAVMMPVLWNFEAILLWSGQKPLTASLAQDYMRIAQWGMFPAMLVMVLRSFLTALERPGLVLWATIIGIFVNAALNYAFIFGNWGAPELGVRGAAIASVLTASVTLLTLVIYTLVNPTLRAYELFVRFWRSDWPAFYDVFRLGWPIGATMLAETGLFSATAVMMGWVGTVELATHGIAIQIASMAFVIYLGFSTAGTVRVGRAIGRGDQGGIWRATLSVFILQLSVAIFVISLFLLIPEVLLGAFLDDDDPAAAAIITFGVGLLLVAAVFQIVDGFQAVALSILRGMKDTTVPMILAVVSYWGIGFPASYLFGFTWGFGGIGVWYGLVIGLSVAAVTMLWRMFWLINKFDPAALPPEQ